MWTRLSKGESVPVFPCLPWKLVKGPSTRFALGSSKIFNAKAMEARASIVSSFSGAMGPLQAIIHYLPLLEAFETFCNKALCGEVSFTRSGCPRQKPRTNKGAWRVSHFVVVQYLEFLVLNK